jgi:hypothetical protein
MEREQITLTASRGNLKQASKIKEFARRARRSDRSRRAPRARASGTHQRVDFFHSLKPNNGLLLLKAFFVSDLDALFVQRPIGPVLTRCVASALQAGAGSDAEDLVLDHDSCVLRLDAARVCSDQADETIDLLL